MVTRFINRFFKQAVAEDFQTKHWEYQFSTIIKPEEQEDILNFDSKVLTRYGDQQEGVAKGYNPKKPGRGSHHPIIAFLNRSRYAVNLWNRMGDRPSNDRIVEFTDQTLERINGRIKICSCLADLGFYEISFIKRLEELNLEYVIAAPHYKTIQAKVLSPQDDAWEYLTEGISIAKFNFRHQKNKEWEIDRRHIVVRQYVETTPKPKGVKCSLFPDDDKKELDFRYGVYCISSKESPLKVWQKIDCELMMRIESKSTSKTLQWKDLS